MFLVLILSLLLSTTIISLFFLYRIRARMAALVAWIVGSITGGRGGEEDRPKLEDKEKGGNDRKGKQKSKKSPESPKFSSNLATPIKDAIEESLKEGDEPDEKELQKSPARIRTRKPARKPAKASDGSLQSSNGKGRTSASGSKRSLEDLQEEEPADPIGFSFFTVKDRKSGRKPAKIKIDDLPKSNLIKHFEQPKKKEVNFADFVIVEEKPTGTRDNLIEIVNKDSGKVAYVESKPSKKVTSKFSYASVVSQGIDAIEIVEDFYSFDETQSPDVRSEKTERDQGSSKTVQDVEVHAQDYFTGESDIEVEETSSANTTEQLIEQEFNSLNSEFGESLFASAEQPDAQLEESLPIETSINSCEPLEGNPAPEPEGILVSEEVKEWEFIGKNRVLLEDTVNSFINECIEKKSEVEISEIEEPVNSSEKLKDYLEPQKQEISLPEVQESEVIKENPVLLEEEKKPEASVAEDPINFSEQLEDYSEPEKQEISLPEVQESENIQENRVVLQEERKPAEAEISHTEDPINSSEQLEDYSESQKHEISLPEVQESEAIKQTRAFLSDAIISSVKERLPVSSELENPKKSAIPAITITDETNNSGVNPSEPFKMSSGLQTRVFTLNHNEHQDTTLYRIQKNWVLQFRLGPTLFGRKVALYCNYPKGNQAFNRNSYNLLEWSQDEGCSHSDDTAVLTELTARISGSFHYYFTYQGDSEHQGSGFFLVDPLLKYGHGEVLPLDCIQCQTVLAKSLGGFDTWEAKLRVAKESGYNMIHFTPIQELGGSNSSYSLSEQLKVNPAFARTDESVPTFEEINSLLKKLRDDWKITSICDIVLNHTANESLWLKEHPESTYNCFNCPYMRPAYLLDATLHQFSRDVAKGVYEDRGIPAEVATEDHLNAIRYHLHQTLALVKVHELYQCDANKYVEEFSNLVRSKTQPNKVDVNEEQRPELILVQDVQYRRLGSAIDMKLALELHNIYRNDCFDEESRIKKSVEAFKNQLDLLNSRVETQIKDHLNAAVENTIAGIRYFRVQPDGPRIREVSKKNPLTFRYFTDFGQPENVKEHEQIMYGDGGKFAMAHNGWVMNSDPLRNFAEADSNVYIRRELIAWGDSVKLRYGQKPSDCPFLWEHMRSYVETTARIFDGVRLDNCHSTPIPVAEYLLDCARKVKPDLYVVAELFTNSDLTDNIFVNRLGITSLIREALSAWDSHEQGRLVYRYGGVPVGSFYQPNVRPLAPSVAHALFLDLTHDNPSPVEKRSVFDLLPSTALVNMACCASGSNRGYDELVPHHIHVVDETRSYTEWTEDARVAEDNPRFVTSTSGIIAAKLALNQLHYRLGIEGFDQVYVDQMDPDIVAVTRHCPDTHQSYVLVAFTAFGHPPEEGAHNQRPIKPLRIEGVLDEIVLEATLIHRKSPSKYAKFQNFVKDTKWINGLNEYEVEIQQHIQVDSSGVFDIVDSGAVNVTQLNFKNFKPGSVAVIKLSQPQDVKDAVDSVRKLIQQFSTKKQTELWEIINAMDLSGLNRALYRCDQEEKDEGHGFDTYNIPGFGNLVYAGFQGFMSLLSKIRPNNDLGHPMCSNLRDGNWMIDYIWQRLKLDPGTSRLGQWFEENSKTLKTIPRYLIPCYFDVIVTGIYVLLIEQSVTLMSDLVRNGSTFVRALALGSVQFGGYVQSADLPQLSPNLTAPPAGRKNNQDEEIQACVTLSAGLPHFSVGYMRNWGRDTFIALRGLFLLTGRYQDARFHILGYAQCLRHALIPNLLDGGRNPRFNCRDALWWWLHCIKCYVQEAPNGIAILEDPVSRIFPQDDSQALKAGEHDEPLHKTIQEALNIHFQGLVFRERNAGKQIDEHMTEKGFNNQIGVHPATGFVFGGNASNCGTWMDKMGSSEKAGNRGTPATPRDGSAVEIIGLAKAAVTWLAELHEKGQYPYEGVERTHKSGNATKWTYREWAQKLQENFEKSFWIPTTEPPLEKLVNKRGIYKDCFGASQDWTDYQLRCNFPIAMVVAPELFTPQNAWIALGNAEKYLLGPLGMRTLDPEDWAYNGFYDNSNDSTDKATAHGFNYHQGPEWVWPVGFYLRARLQFAGANGQLEKTIEETKHVLSRHFTELQTSDWRGLPELTNKDGAYCKDSSRTQAWSMSCILEVLHDLQQLEKSHQLIN